MKYANIVFTYDYESKETMELLKRLNRDSEAIQESINYLSQWDNGQDSEYDLSDKPPYGTSDYTEQIGRYILSYNLQLGYMGLVRIVFSNEEEQLIASLCDDIAMQYNGQPNANDIEDMIADYESIYDTIVSNDIVSDIYRSFDVEQTYNVYEYDKVSNNYRFVDCMTIRQLKRNRIDEQKQYIIK